MRGVEVFLPGERVLWEGRPLRHRLFRITDVAMVPLQAVALWLAVAWGRQALSDDTVGNGAMAFAAILLIVLFLVLAPFIERAVLSRSTRYTVTTRRLIVRKGRAGDRVVMVYLNSLPPPVIFVESDGSGSLTFGAFPTILDALANLYGPRTWSARSQPPRPPVLWDVPDIKRVRDFIAHARTQPGGVYRV
ncbi:hypothetical protein Areg01_56020 [Actinoplanes regularis]|nr:hypothetical protein Areg01_56020 [Actinoplanes regularis]